MSKFRVSNGGFTGLTGGMLIGAQTHTNVNSNEVCAGKFYGRDSGGTLTSGFAMEGDRVLMYGAGGITFNLLQFGGETSSFPALKRSTTYLQGRLADDSAFCFVQGKLTTETAQTATVDVACNGYLTLYDSTGTAFKVMTTA